MAGREVTESNACGSCCFMGSLATECEFEFWRKYLSSERVPSECPKRIPKNTNWRRRPVPIRRLQRRPLNELELRVLNAIRSRTGNFGIRCHQVINLINGHRIGRHSHRYTNINTVKKIGNALRFLQHAGIAYCTGGRWFPLEARGVGESNQPKAARGA